MVSRKRARFGIVDGYSDGAWHNIQIKVVGNELKASVDNQPWSTQALKEEFYESGYVSLCSVNNFSEYRNFRIKALPEPEKGGVKDFEPVKEADADDAATSGCSGSLDAATAALAVFMAIAVVAIIMKKRVKDENV